MQNGLLGIPRNGNKEVLELKRGPEIGFTIAARYGDTGLRIPVPTIRPTIENSSVALDITPKGPSPVEFAGNGYAWLDVCDADVQDANSINGASVPIRCARVAMTSTGAQFGSVPFNGASTLPIEFLYGFNTVVGRMTNVGLAVGSATRTPLSRIEATDDTIVNFMNVFSGEGVTGTSTNHPYSIWTNNTKRVTFDTSGNVALAAGNVTAQNIYSSGGSLKTVQTVDVTNRSTTSTSFAASSVISPSITPTSASNKIKIDVSGLAGASSGQGAFFTLFRSIGGAAYADITPAGVTEMQGFVITDANSSQAVGFSFLDSPATTAAVLYQVYFKSNAGATVYLGRRGADTLFDSPTIITATEIKG